LRNAINYLGQAAAGREGILNVTPDSFSDGGEFCEPGKGVAHAIKSVKDGADIYDIGGESTRPGTERIGADVRIERVLPVIEQIVQSLPKGFPLSIDTMPAAAAERGIRAGASIINDISTPPARMMKIGIHWRRPRG
jgi:dihydropteroate synthase